MFLFVRFLPAISIFEMREVLHHLAPAVVNEGPGHAPRPRHGD
jgi:hypothetical protein